MLSASSSIALLEKIEAENLYLNLVQQLNKDFQLSNLNFSFEATISPVDLKEKLSAILARLLTNNYDDYLVFLYRVDVSEKEMAKITATDFPKTVDQITFLVLKRAFQKVWLKKNY